MDASNSVISALRSGQSRPNSELSQDEKSDKRLRKRHLKQTTRLRKYQMRLSQALARNDSDFAVKARAELDEYLIFLKQEHTSIWYQNDFQVRWQTQKASMSPVLAQTKSDDMQQSKEKFVDDRRKWITRFVWQKLIVRIKEVPPRRGDNQSSKSKRLPTTKQNQTEEARSLLSHMTKGTQTETMFQNDNAIIGYTRQKFMERAILAMKSLHQLELLTYTKGESSKAAILWKRLHHVNHVVSIGCGPGCDAVGVLSFLQAQRSSCRSTQGSRVQDSSSALQRLLLLDYVMPQWRRLVLDELSSILTPAWVANVEMACCDVRSPLVTAYPKEKNYQAWNSLRNGIHNGGGSRWDLIVVSYLLTETRGKWVQFFRDLLEHCRQGPPCLLLLSEPTAWQLHNFLKTFEDYLDDHQWLDSSMHFPELQSLEARLGPAVLLVQTRASTGVD